MSVAYVVIGVPVLVFAVIVLFDIGRWSSIKNVIPTSWRMTLGLLWAVTGCGLLVTGILGDTSAYVWGPGVVGALVFFYFLKKAQQDISET